MKLAVLRFVVVALACACAVIVISNLRAQRASANQDKFTPLYSALGMPQPAQTPAAGAEKTIAQEGREKNIKLLGDMPVSQFIPVMNYFASSLGRRCNFCHVNTNGQWDYASDAKPEKNTAREMIKLVLDTNKNFFKGNTEVSCYVCHRGRNNPLTVPPLPLPTPSTGFGPGGGVGPGGGGQQPAGAQPQGSPTPRPTPTPAEEILNKYVTAVGGQAAIDKIKSRTATGTITTANGQSGTYELIQTADKALETITTPRAAIKLALTGTSGWESNGPNSRELAGADLTRVRNAYQLFSFLKLKDQYTRLRSGGRDRIGDRDAYVVTASRSETEVERLFFDVETGLLLRRITYLRTMVGVIPQQWDFEDYRDVDGVKMPFTIKLSTTEAGNPFNVRKFTEIKLNGPVDDSKFAMPPAPPKP